MNFFNLDSLPRQRYLLYLAFFTAFAVTAYILESFVPKPLPFMKLGLSNVVILALLITENIKPALIVALAKTFIGGLLTGMLIGPTTLLSLTGTFTALAFMILFLRLPVNFSIIGISIIGAVTHNFGQIIIVRLVLIKENSIFYLTPVLILMGIVTGIITGYIAKIFVDKMN